MNLYQIMKKGQYVIESIDEDLKGRLNVYGIREGSGLYVSSILTCGYRVVICDDRLLALPMWVCRGIVL